MTTIHEKSNNKQDTLLCWILAIALSLNNLINGWLWISYATIHDFTVNFYSSTALQINWLTIVYGVIICIVGFPAIWFIEKYGIKRTLLLTAILNLTCTVLRSISSWIPNNRYPILMLGQIFGGISQPFTIFSSTKLAAIWFSDKHRITANTLSSMGNPLGVVLANFIAPYIVKNKTEVPIMNDIYLGLAIFVLLFTLFAIITSPKESNQINIITLKYHEQLLICCKNKNFMLLNITFAIIIGVFTTVSSLIQQILCPWGYDHEICGWAGASVLAAGFPGSLICGLIVYCSNRRLLFEVVQLGVYFCTLSMVLFSVICTLPNQNALLFISLISMGFFGFGCYPAALELAAEITWPANEAVSTGLLLLLSQIFGIIAIPVCETSAPQIKAIYIGSTCQIDDVKDYWVPVTVLVVICCLVTALFCFGLVKKFTRSQGHNFYKNDKRNTIESCMDSRILAIDRFNEQNTL